MVLACVGCLVVPGPSVDVKFLIEIVVSTGLLIETILFSIDIEVVCFLKLSPGGTFVVFVFLAR